MIFFGRGGFKVSVFFCFFEVQGFGFKGFGFRIQGFGFRVFGKKGCSRKEGSGLFRGFLGAGAAGLGFGVLLGPKVKFRAFRV